MEMCLSLNNSEVNTTSLRYEISGQLRLQLIVSIRPSITVPDMFCADLALVLWEGVYYRYIVCVNLISWDSGIEEK
jgi:hypothetical protein